MHTLATSSARTASRNAVLRLHGSEKSRAGTVSLSLSSAGFGRVVCTMGRRECGMVEGQAAAMHARVALSGELRPSHTAVSFKKHSCSPACHQVPAMQLLALLGRGVSAFGLGSWLGKRIAPGRAADRPKLSGATLGSSTRHAAWRGGLTSCSASLLFGLQGQLAATARSRASPTPSHGSAGALQLRRPFLAHTACQHSGAHLWPLAFALPLQWCARPEDSYL